MTHGETAMPFVPTAQDNADMARLGPLIYARDIQPHLTPADDGKFVAIDVDTGEYSIDADHGAATGRLHAKREAARVWVERAGRPTALRMPRLSVQRPC